MTLLLLLAACKTSTPQPSGGTDACPSGEVLDGDACVPEACGVGTWGDLPVDGVTVYVAEGGDGDGTVDSPLGSIQAALDLAGERDGGLVAVAAGTYMETLAMGGEHDGVTLGGRCREMVTIDGSAGEEVPAVEVVGGIGRQPEIGIEGVTVTAGRYSGLWVEAATVSVEGVDVVESSLVGVVVVAAEVTLTEVGVYDTAPNGGDFGQGIGVWDGATLAARGCTVAGSTGSGVTAFNDGTTVYLEDTVVQDTAPRPDESGGEGIATEDGANLKANRCTVTGSTGIGLFARDDGTMVELEDTYVIHTAPSPDGSYGRGIDVEGGAMFTATACTVQGNTEVGMFASNNGTVVELVNTIVQDTAAGLDGWGEGIRVQDGAELSATGCTVHGSNGVGVSADGVSTTVELFETVVQDTVPGVDGSFGSGILVDESATLMMTACTVQGNTYGGVWASDDGTTVELRSTVVRDTTPRPDGVGGMGIIVEEGATLTATGSTVEGSTAYGVFAADDGTTVELVDTLVQDTGPSPGGTGISVAQGAAFRATGCIAQRNLDVGVHAEGDGTTVELVNTVVQDTAPSPDGSFGRGINVQDGATLTARGTTVQRNSEFGVFAGYDGTTVELVDTVVQDTAPSPDGSGGVGVGAQDGATLTAIGCTVQGNTLAGVVASKSGTTVELVDTVVQDTTPSPDGSFGRGIGVQGGATLTAAACTVQGNTELGVVASDSGTTVELVDTDIQDTRRGPITGFAIGVAIQSSATLTLDSCTVSGSEGPGIYAADDANITLTSTELMSNAFAGALVLDAFLTLDDVTITETAADAQWGGGFGIYALDLFGTPALTVHSSTIGPHPHAAVWLDGDGTYLLEDNDLSGNTPVDLRGREIHGNAVFAERGVQVWDGTSGLSLVGNRIHGATDVAVLLDGSSAFLDGNSFDANGTDVWQQRCDDVAALDSPEPDWVACDGGTLLTDSALQFTTLYLPEVEPE